MNLQGLSTTQQIIDEVVRHVWNQRHPDRPQPTGYESYTGDPELTEITNTVRAAVFAAVQEATPPQAAVPPPDAEWQDQQELARIAAKAYLQTGF